MSYHIGLDVHKKTTTATIMDDAGKVLDKRKLLNQSSILKDYFYGIPGYACITMEATRNWYWMNDLIEEVGGLEVKLAHPKKVRLIAESVIKTDEIDSKVLADLERTNFLPQSYLAPKDIRETRELLRFRMSLVRMRTMAKNKIHAVLAKNGINTELFKDLYGKKGRVFLSQLETASIFRHEIDGYLELIDHLNEKIAEAEKEIRKIVKEENPDARLLMTVPGLGYFLSLLIAAEIGDVKRFPSHRKLCSYAGVVGSTSQSSDNIHQGHIIKDSNKYIRWALLEAVEHAIKADPHLQFCYNNTVWKKGKQKARVAIARRLVISIYFMLKNRTEYRIRSGEKFYSGKNQASSSDYMVNK